MARTTVYATHDDLTGIYLRTDILAQITTTSGTTPDDTVIDACCSAASDRIDFMLGARIYSTAETQSLKDPCCRIAVKMLCERYGITIPLVSLDAERAEDQLSLIAQNKRGKFGLFPDQTATDTMPYGYESEVFSPPESWYIPPNLE